MNTTANFQPLYQQIKMLIMQNVINGEWGPGDLMPSETDLAVRFGVSQGTVRKAVDELAGENIVIRYQGKGTFIATHSEETIKLRFLRLTSDLGKEEVIDSRLISYERVRVNPVIAKKLDVKPNSHVIEVKRLLLFADTPVVFDRIILPLPTFKKVSEEIISAFKGSMYRMYEKELGIHTIRAEEKITAVLSDEETAGFLNIPINNPLLRVERLSYTFGDKAMEWRLGLYLTTHHHYLNNLN